jgi:hypothetical protein
MRNWCWNLLWVKVWNNKTVNPSPTEALLNCLMEVIAASEAQLMLQYLFSKNSS